MADPENPVLAAAGPTPATEADWAALDTNTYLHHALAHVLRADGIPRLSYREGPGKWVNSVMLPAHRRDAILAHAKQLAAAFGGPDPTAAGVTRLGGWDVLWRDSGEAPKLAAVLVRDEVDRG